MYGLPTYILRGPQEYNELECEEFQQGSLFDCHRLRSFIESHYRHNGTHRGGEFEARELHVIAC